VWTVQVTCRSNYLYQLERSTNLVAWAPVSTEIAATGTRLDLQDPAPPAGTAVYRVRVKRP
jgi:hypothetical protein